MRSLHATFPGPFAAGLLIALNLNLGTTAVAQAKSFEEYLKPTPITCSPLSSATWGAVGVLPRDTCNGIESAKGAAVPPDYYYWDGQIIRAKDGKYHMFMSTWAGSAGFNPGWTGSDAYHAISETSVLGPYKRQDFVYSNNGSHKGHNVSALELPDGSYAVVVSEIVPFTIYKSNSLDGPWVACQPTSGIGGSNISLVPRHDGRFQIVERNGTIAISDTLCGNYVKQKPMLTYAQNTTDAQGNPVVGSIYAKRTSIPGVSNPSYLWQEDPHIWRSGGTYHVIYSGSGDRVGWWVHSVDGINDWKDGGYAWSPRDYQKIFCYEGSTTCSQWYKMERPGVVLQDGHPTHITWAVADVDKDNMIPAGSNHGSKVIVVPFDGVAFDADNGTGAVGGSSGSGGAGGNPGKGGAGGTSGSGGKGGAAGGTSGSGGAPMGGASGRGGSGGSVASGGTMGGVDAGATGGTSSGGTVGSGGALASGGASGGTSSGGAVGSGGTTSTASGGSSASGGAPSGSGGSSSSGGSSGADASTGATGGEGGCACALGTNAAPGPLGSVLLGLTVALSLRRRRRGFRP
jgi:MYXO-CTERM domain-containing protein